MLIYHDYPRDYKREQIFGLDVISSKDTKQKTSKKSELNSKNITFLKRLGFKVKKV